MPVDSVGFPVLRTPLQSARANSLVQTQRRIGQRGILPVDVKSRLLAGGATTGTFTADSVTDTSVRTFTSLTITEVPGTTITFTLDRETKVFIIATTQCKFSETSSETFGNGWIYINIDGVDDQDSFLRAGWVYSAGEGGDSPTTSPTYASVKTLGKGEHTIKLGGASIPTDADFKILQTTVTFLVLGN